MNSFLAAGSIGTLLEDTSLALPSSVVCEIGTSGACHERWLVMLTGANKLCGLYLSLARLRAIIITEYLKFSPCLRLRGHQHFPRLGFGLFYVFHHLIY